jgi:hypothetical protein
MVSGLVPIEYYINAAIRNIPGTTTGTKTGGNDNIPSANAIILSNVTSAAFPSNQPVTAQQMQVVSTSANDTAAGIGAQQVEITYLTAPFPTNVIDPFKKKTEIVTLNGLGVVTTTATNIFRIDRFRISRVGSTGVAAGNISLQSVGGATTFERIETGLTGADSAAHYVEKGYGTLLTGLTFGCSTAGGTILYIIITEPDPLGNRVGIGQLRIELANNAVAKVFGSPKFAFNPDGRETFALMAVKGRTANQTASGSFGFVDFPL